VDALGAAAARAAGIPTRLIPRTDYPTLGAQKAAILTATQDAAPDLVVLAGFMQIVAPEFLAAFPRRVINIHPALLPKFPGLDTHARALAAHESAHGCTVHVVDAGIDTGDIIAQAAVPVSPDDTAETLGKRVLTREHVLYPWVVNEIARGEIGLDYSPVTFTPNAQRAATVLDFNLPGS
jgi:phosphoribosylglycinamide formyltransferase-1